MIFLLVILNKKSGIIQPIKERGQEQTVSGESVLLSGENNSVSLLPGKTGVTFIKKNNDKRLSEKSLLPAAEDNFQASIPSQSSAPYGGNGIESSSKATSTDIEESSGITKISKHPTVERKKEMADKGILLF
jgi:hypothetical protein